MKLLFALLALSCIVALVPGEELTNLLHKLSSDHRDMKDEVAARQATKNKQNADKALARIMDRLDDVYPDILDFKFNKLSKRKFKKIGKIMTEILWKEGDIEKLLSLKLRLLSGISEDIFEQYADFLNQLLKAEEKDKLETNSQVNEPCLLSELLAQKRDRKELDRTETIKHRPKTVCFYLAKNLAGNPFLEGMKECGRLQGVNNKGGEVSEFIEILHRLPHKSLSIRQATKVIFYNLHKVYVESPVAVYTGLPGWRSAITPCKTFLKDYGIYLTSSIGPPQGLKNNTRSVYMSVLAKASEPMAWLKQNIDQRNDILKATDEDSDSTRDYFFDYIYDLIQIEKNNAKQ